MSRGAAAVEMAVISPLLLAIVFGIVEFGWLLTVQNTLTNAAREGARTGVLEGNGAADAQARVIDYLTPAGLADKVSIIVSEPGAGTPLMTVQLTVPRSAVSLVGSFFGFNGGQLEASCSMRKEGL